MRMRIMAIVALAAVAITTGPSHAHVPKYCGPQLEAWASLFEPIGDGRDMTAQATVDYRNDPTEANWQKLANSLVFYITTTNDLLKKSSAFLLCTGMPAGQTG